MRVHRVFEESRRREVEEREGVRKVFQDVLSISWGLSFFLSQKDRKDPHVCVCECLCDSVCECVSVWLDNRKVLAT